MRIAEAFQIFKLSQYGVRMGARGAPCAFTKVAGKLRKSKNGATSDSRQPMTDTVRNDDYECI